jgi:16S rRNA (uracil1498-N3)-methyltransferase
LHIAIAPTKSIERFEWFLEKATEIGIDEITPVLCENSERDKIKTDRLNKVLISAMKQSLKVHLPKLNQLIKLDNFIPDNFNGEKYIAHCKTNHKNHLKNIYHKGTNCLVLIGPEGDFGDNEIKLFSENNYKQVSLGNSRLRTETAGIAACHIVNLINET